MKQNFQLHYFSGKTKIPSSQVWCTPIARLLMTVIQKKANKTCNLRGVAFKLEIIIADYHKIRRHYFHDFSKNRIVFDTELSVRLTKQFSVFGEIEAQVVHDQLYLPKGDASLEDILLERRKQATTYELGGQVGFRFTFGSIYNSVVNERFKNN